MSLSFHRVQTEPLPRWGVLTPPQTRAVPPRRAAGTDSPEKAGLGTAHFEQMRLSQQISTDTHRDFSSDRPRLPSNWIDCCCLALSPTRKEHNRFRNRPFAQQDGRLIESATAL